ncbi:MAG: hypothetical protein KatS3mg105_4629 [Gemmatales bacterium]|nr:MAG: hypothetical protein KatS3mg105_4629 [Gemmatales bacterium]
MGANSRTVAAWPVAVDQLSAEVQQPAAGQPALRAVAQANEWPAASGEVCGHWEWAVMWAWLAAAAAPLPDVREVGPVLAAESLGPAEPAPDHLIVVATVVAASQPAGSPALVVAAAGDWGSAGLPLPASEARSASSYQLRVSLRRPRIPHPLRLQIPLRPLPRHVRPGRYVPPIPLVWPLVKALPLFPPGLLSTS